jgi:hypothetical protein
MQLNTTYSFDSSHWPAGLQHCIEGLDQKIITSSHISSLQWHFQSPNKCLLFLLFGSHYTLLFLAGPSRFNSETNIKGKLAT